LITRKTAGNQSFRQLFSAQFQAGFVPEGKNIQFKIFAAAHNQVSRFAQHGATLNAAFKFLLGHAGFNLNARRVRNADFLRFDIDIAAVSSALSQAHIIAVFIRHNACSISTALQRGRKRVAQNQAFQPKICAHFQRLRYAEKEIKFGKKCIFIVARRRCSLPTQGAISASAPLKRKTPLYSAASEKSATLD
jgi:hypothetical protein